MEQAYYNELLNYILNEGYQTRQERTGQGYQESERGGSCEDDIDWNLPSPQNKQYCRKKTCI
jgi:hypothetical protein